MPELSTRADEPQYTVEQVISLRCPNCENPDCAEALEYIKKIETRLMSLNRLQSAVVEAAKAHRQSRAIGHASIRITSACRVCQDEKVFNAAVDALIAFEAEHKIDESEG